MDMEQDDLIPEDISMKDLQNYVWRINQERGFNLTDPSKKLVMLMEEVGELAKAVRKESGMKFSRTTTRTNIEDELADVQIVLLGLAGICGVDMVAAVAKKEIENRRREWK